MEFRVLGPLEVYSNGQPLPLGGRRQRLVLATLILHSNEVVSTDRLIDAVWGDLPPRTARKSLQAYISRLRATLGSGGSLESLGSGYILRVSPDQVDSNRFADLARIGREALATDPGRAVATLNEALGLWHGSVWGDLSDEPVLRPDVERLGEMYLAAVEDRLEAELDRGDAAGLVGQLEGLISTHPLRERLRGLLMTALYREGRQAEALRVYQETRRLLAEELGIEPSPDLQRLEEQILLQDQALDPSSGTARPLARPDIPNPYKGLRPFSESDAEDFFGRDGLVGVLIDRLADERFLVVVGPSGSGKSSAVRAGLVPALRRGAILGSDAWLIAGMLPGAHPFEALEAALLRAAQHAPESLAEQMRGNDLDLLRAALRVLPGEKDQLVLLIDQFEEVFLLVEDEAERARFIRNLTEAVEDPHSPLRVVVTLRADFFDRPLDYPGLAELVTHGQVNVLPIDAPGLEEAVVRPAGRVGVRVEPELVAEIVSDVVAEPGGLPLFEFVLTELSDRRTTDMLTLADYRELGGLRGALSRRAEIICDRLDEVAFETARQVFLRLVTLGEGTEDTRRRVLRSELEALESGSSLDDVLDLFGTARLLTFDRDAASGVPTVEVAHEALLREWPRFRGWVEDARNDLRLQRNLDSEARQWEAAGRDSDYLLAGSRLTLFEDWSKEGPVALSATEYAYLDASARRRDEKAAAERERRERELELERRSVSRLRVLVAVMAIAAATAVGLTMWALDSRSDAREHAAVAEQRFNELTISSQVIRMKELTTASISVRDVDPELSLILALHAVDLAIITDQPVLAETIAALHWGLQAVGVQYPSDPEPGVVLGSPDGLKGVFPLHPGELITLAHDRVTRGLTDDECRAYFEDGLCPTLSGADSAALIASEELETFELVTGKPLAGTRVTVLGASVDEEAAALRAEFEAFTKATGIEVDYDAAGNDLEGRLIEKMEEGRPPDLALIPQPAFIREAAQRGALMELGAYVDVEALRTDQSPYVVAMASVGEDGAWPSYDGAVFGALMRASVKSLIWYPVPEFEEAGYRIPLTWGELVELTDQMIDDGRTPWCHGEESGFASGWPGTDWIEDLVLHEYGPDVYDEWVAHDIRFDDPRIKSAWEHMNAVLLEEGHVYPDRQAAAVIGFPLAANPMFDDPPTCWLHHQASFLPNFFPAGAKVGTDAAAFAFPPVDPEYVDSIVGGGDYLISLTDRPEVRSLVEFMLGDTFGLEMVEMTPGHISPNRDFPLAAYQNEWSRQLAVVIRDALDTDSFRFDASDLMHPAVGLGAFWKAVLEFVAFGPDNLDQLLADIEAAWADAESEEAS